MSPFFRLAMRVDNDSNKNDCIEAGIEAILCQFCRFDVDNHSWFLRIFLNKIFHAKKYD